VNGVSWTKQTLNHWYRIAMPIFDASLAYEFYGIGGPEILEAIDESGGYRGSPTVP